MTTAWSRRSPSARCSTAIREKSMADLYRDLPLTFGTPTMSPHCADEVKYGVVEKVLARFPGDEGQGRRRWPARRSPTLVTVNGVRVVAEDGTWGLVRASSNKPELVVVVESPVSSERRREMFEAVDAGAAPQSRSRRLQPDVLTAIMADRIVSFVMSGGVGSRLWPLSREDNPKQFHDLSGDGSMLVEDAAAAGGAAGGRNADLPDRLGKACRPRPHRPCRDRAVRRRRHLRAGRPQHRRGGRGRRAAHARPLWRRPRAGRAVGPRDLDRAPVLGDHRGRRGRRQ